MAVEQYTEKAQQAIAAAQSMARERDQQIIEPQHLLAALLSAREGIVVPLLEKAGANIAALGQAATDAVGRLPVVRGGAGQHLGQLTREVLETAGREAERMGDE